MIGTITFNPSIDRNIFVKNLIKDDANRALSIFSTAGGKGVNVSKVIVELGGKTHAYVPLGGLPGELFKQLIAHLHIPYSVMPVKGETRINTILTDLKDGTQTRISAPGPVMTMKDVARFTRMLLSARPRPFLWALGGSLPQSMRPSVYREVIFTLQKNGVPCVLDTDNEALKLGIEARPFMIKPNEYEMHRLMGREFNNLGEIVLGARQLVKKGIKIVIVSLGAKGAIFATEKEVFCFTTPKVPVRSKVGAGDSLIGGVVFGLSKKMSLKEAARLGIAASTSAVMREAPRLCLRSDIPSLLPRVKIHQISN